MKSNRVRSYKDLEVWRRGMALVREVYLATRSIPPNETFGLVTQLRRTVVSIPSNIAEGNARRRNDYIRLLLVARGSIQELETQLLIAGELRYLAPEVLEHVLRLNSEVGRLLAGLIRSLSRLNRVKQRSQQSPQSPVPSP